MMGHSSPCSALFFSFLIFFFPECTSTQVRMAELPGNSQKPLAFGTICPAAFLLSLIRKEWGWMQSTSPPLDVMRLCKLDLLYSISTPFFSCVFLFLFFLCSFFSCSVHIGFFFILYLLCAHFHIFEVIQNLYTVCI